MKRTIISGLLVVLALASIGAADDKKATVLLQAAQAREAIQGDLKGAIALYQDVVNEAGGNRAIAARALVRMAECYQKLGDAEARKIFERVVKDYSDQKDAVTIARARLGGRSLSASTKIDRAVWTGPRVNYYGTVSSDGRLLSYWVSDGNLALHDFATGTDRTLTDKGYATGEFAADFSTVSRDGKHVAYTWWGDKKRYELRVVDTQGSGVPPFRRLLDNEEINKIRPFDWSPDGRWIAVQLGRLDQSGQIALVSVTDGALRVLKSVGWNGPSKICFSPDGRYIAYDLASDDAGAQGKIFVLSADGSRETTAVTDGSTNLVMGWSPDGKHLVYSSNRTGGWTLWALPIEDGRPQGSSTRLRTLDAPASLGISTSGALYTLKLDIYRELSIASLDWDAGKFAAAPSSPPQGVLGSNRLPDWSPDGKFLAYVFDGQGGHFIKILSIATGEIRELHPGLPRFIRPRWSPDGRSFVVSGYDVKGRPGIYKIDAQSGATSPLILGSADLSGPQGSALPVWSPDGRFIYYKVLNDTRSSLTLMERDLASGTDREIARGVPGDISVSPDGRYIAAPAGARADGKCYSLLLIPATGGAPRELLRLNQPEAFSRFWSVDWTRDSSAVLAIKETGPHRELWQIPIEGGQPRKLDIDIDGWSNGEAGFRIHPDGRQIVFSTGRNAIEIWALENFLPAPNR